MIKSILKLTVICVLANFTVKAQAPAKPLNWTPYYKDSKIEVSYKYANCNAPNQGTNEENVYLQIVNLTNDLIKVQWTNELWYGEKCYNCDGTNPEMNFTIELKGKEMKAGACNDIADKNLKIFSKFLNIEDKTELKEFKLKNIKIELSKL